MNDLIKIAIDCNNNTVVFNINIYIIGLTLVFLISIILYRFKVNKWISGFVKPVKFKLKMGGSEIEYVIERNYKNIEIANNLFVEITTRKAAIQISEDDVIEEVYNSWYKLFEITRNALKSIPGKFIYKNESYSEISNLLTDILNRALRPHLTTHQAAFRKWYSKQLTEQSNSDKTPQEIQTQYPNYDELISSMKSVNKTLLEYSKELKKIVMGE